MFLLLLAFFYNELAFKTNNYDIFRIQENNKKLVKLFMNQKNEQTTDTMIRRRLNYCYIIQQFLYIFNRSIYNLQ